MARLLRRDGFASRIRAHDVRHMRPCAGCDGLADAREAVAADGAVWHPRCFHDANGLAGLEALAPEERRKVRISDVPAGIMKRLIELDGVR